MGLKVHFSSFSCPYCGKEWDRGGHKEGFVKAAATRHVHGCYEVWLYAHYKLFAAGWRAGQQVYITEQEAKKYPRFRKAVLSLVRRRKREGYNPAEQR